MSSGEPDAEQLTHVDQSETDLKSINRTVWKQEDFTSQRETSSEAQHILIMMFYQDEIRSWVEVSITEMHVALNYPWI